jgi:hypothetical protein
LPQNGLLFINSDFWQVVSVNAIGEDKFLDTGTAMGIQVVAPH